MDKIKIAIVGARGIGNYGGFETVVSELAPRFAENGYEVYCSCEKSGQCNANLKNGVNLCYFPLPPPKSYFFRKIFEIIYDLYFILRFSIGCDIIYQLGIGGGPLLFLPRIFGNISLVNIDGVEWERSKFGGIEKKLLKILFDMSCFFSNYIVIDNRCLINYIKSTSKYKAIYIPYGVNIHKYIPWDIDKLNSSYPEILACDISPGEYWLAVARLEPENSINIIVKAFLEIDARFPLIIIGGFTNDRYRIEIYELIKKSCSKNKILFMGPIYNQEILDMFRQNCLGYIHGHTVGGTNPSLLEAMIMRNIILAHDNEFNRDVCKDSSLYFRKFDDLGRLIENVEKNPAIYAELKRKAYEIANSVYSWNDVIQLYYKHFSEFMHS